MIGAVESVITLVEHLSTELRRFRAGAVRRVVTAGGHHWPYLDAGPRAGSESVSTVPILMIHGFGREGSYWLKPMIPLSRNYRVIAPDLPGFGGNRINPDVRYTSDKMSELLGAFTSNLGIERYHLIGSSMGGLVAGYHASCYQERAVSLCLMDSAGIDPPVLSDFWRRQQSTGENLFLPYDREGFRLLLTHISHSPPRVPPPVADHFLHKIESRRVAFEKVFSDLLSLGMNPLRPRLPYIRCPTLIMWGRDDRIIDVSSVPILEKEIADSRSVIFDGIGHSLMSEVLQEVMDEYRRFLAEAETSLKPDTAHGASRH